MSTNALSPKAPCLFLVIVIILNSFFGYNSLCFPFVLFATTVTNGIRQGYAVVVSADGISHIGDVGLVMHVQNMASIVDGNVIAFYCVSVIPFVGISHEHALPALEDCVD